MREVWCVCLYCVEQCAGDRILGSGLCMLPVLGGVPVSKWGVVGLRIV